MLANLVEKREEQHDELVENISVVDIEVVFQGIECHKFTKLFLWLLNAVTPKAYSLHPFSPKTYIFIHILPSIIQ
jgi:hypothetical protein